MKEKFEKSKLCRACFFIQKDGKVFSLKLSNMLIYLGIVSSFFIGKYLNIDHLLLAFIKSVPGIFLCNVVLTSQVWKNSKNEKV